MNWKPIVPLSMSGVVMGVASVLGVTQGIEWLLWLIIAMLCALLLVRNLRAKQFRSAFLVGLSASILNGVVQSMYINAYLSNNPQVAADFEKVSGVLNPRLFVLISSAVIGGIYGVVMGVFTVLGNRVFKSPS